ncbi:hypothetical protein P3X46_010285 [Hevea brasiliensis]|uniref:Protein kinase domain-containing protein n=1 Tax=Hevea brasiliensis TaxID=3981 RepID=A0ABQ9MDK8_HEVBR|nr:rust resistance kinase Lr10 [Hevea brasiliensis]KAJ9178399.1 hypothetical protein P3X46_010285 [Hevea brasiliensis]
MMNFCLIYFLILVLVDHGFGFNMDECKESKCGGHGPAVRFPFRIKGQQPDSCGYPETGFDLSCSERKETVLELPNSVKLLVKNIDYVAQVIYTSDPQDCLPRQLSNFNLSASSFRFRDIGLFNDQSSLFNCSWRKNTFFQMPCLSAPGYQVYVFSSRVSMDNIALLYCAKMYDVSLVPDDMIDGNNILHLNWSIPSCGSCAAKGKFCRLKANTTEPEIECYGKLRQIKWSSAKFVATGIVLVLILLVVVGIVVYRIYSFNRIEKEYQSKIEKFLDDYKAFKPARYSHADIKRITNHFKEELGQGAYGTVFKGKLSDEILTAVKVLNNSQGNGEEFVNEVGTIGKIHHVNVVRLIGFCADGFRRALVYEYLPNTLEKFISSPNAENHFLGWKRLEDIALGIAKGIEYLHQGCNQRILHFDIKPHNILLDHNFNPKISDFGLAKLCSKDQSAVSMTTARGTIGYIAPEVFSRNFGNVSYKSDVYSFGMLVLEMVGGRKSTVDVKERTSDQIYFPEWIYNLLEGGEDLRLEIDTEEDNGIAKKLAIVGLWCIQWNPVHRPSMKTVVQMLEGDGSNLTTPANPFTSTAPAERIHPKIPSRSLYQDLEIIKETE